MIEKAQFETTRGNLQKMLKWISAPLDEAYDKAWLNITEEQVNAVSNMGQSAISYCTFEEPFVQDVQLHESVDENGVQTLVNYIDVENYIDFVGGERVEVTFFGNEDETLCRRMRIDGDIEVDIYVPHSEADFNSIQTGIIQRYNDSDRWLNSDSEPMGTQFTTKVQEFERIVRVTEFDDFALSTYPVSIEDEEFILDASDDDGRNSVSGRLESSDVSGPDVNNFYSAGFAELFDNISGEVVVDIEQDFPMSVVRRVMMMR